MLTVNFAFSGTELIGITAGEAENPQKAIPEAIRTTLWRLIVFFIGSIVVMAALIPYHTAGVTQSPFVYVLDLIHVPFAANIINFVVLTAIISAANSGLYASTRMLWSLGNEVSGLAVVFVWTAIAWSELKFRRAFLNSGHQLSELKYKTPWYPVIPYFAFISSLLSCVLIWFDPTQRVALYYTIPFVAICYLGHHFWLKSKKNNEEVLLEK